MQVVEHLKGMDAAAFLGLYEGLAQQGFGPMDREVAASLKFRPQAIRKLPMDQRARRAKQLLERSSNEEMAYELFGTYLMRCCEGLIPGFLDKTGVPHNEGMIEDIEAALPDAEKLPTAVSELEEEFGQPAIDMYLAMAASQWPKVAEIDALWRERTGLAEASADS